ncbi:MAG TPA: FHA domain-containing protein, partial [Anaerolineales bacterium]
MIQSSHHKLILRKGTDSSQEFELTRPEIVIGRDSNVDVVISAPAVSHRHARLIREGEGYILEDLGSTNGTHLNGQRLVGRQPLRSGDQIRLGASLTLTYEAMLTGTETAARSTPAPAYSGSQTVVGVDLEPLVNASPPRLIVSIAGSSSQTHLLKRPTLTIGRLEDNDIVIPSPIVSGKHARLEQVSGGYRLVVAQEARNPVLFEGRPLDGPRVLRHGDTFRIGSLDPGMMATLTYDAPGEVSREVERSIVFGEKTLIQVGRDPSNDVVLSSPNVS